MYNEPKFQAWIQEPEKPQVTYDRRPGRWIGMDHWPNDDVTSEKCYPSSQTLTEDSHEDTILIPSVQEHGFYAGTFCPFGQPGDLPVDQRLENGKAVVFTSEPLQEDVDYFGEPVFHARLSADRDNAMVVVRLMDKAPTGESTLISWGMLNLNHYKSHEHPEALVPGDVYDVKVKLDSLGQKLTKGHRLEVAIAPTYWTKACPSPKPVNLTLYTGEKTYLDLPVRHPNVRDKDVRVFDIAETAPIIERDVLRQEERSLDVVHAPIDSTWQIIDYSDEGSRKLKHNGVEHGSINKNVYTIKENDPLSATAECFWELTVGRDAWQTKVETHSKMTSDETNFYLTHTIKAYENDQEVASN